MSFIQRGWNKLQKWWWRWQMNTRYPTEDLRLKALTQQLQKGGEEFYQELNAALTSVQRHHLARRLLHHWEHGNLYGDPVLVAVARLGSNEVIPTLMRLYESSEETPAPRTSPFQSYTMRRRDYIIQGLVALNTPHSLWYLFNLWFEVPVERSTYMLTTLQKAGKDQQTTLLTMLEQSLPAANHFQQEWQLDDSSYHSGIDQRFRLYLQDATGKQHFTLPSAAEGTPHLARWEKLQAEAHHWRYYQSLLFEQAMITARRWTMAEFQTTIWQCPLVRDLARGLVWGVYDDTDEVTITFRIAEDFTLADIQDRQMTLNPAPTAHIGILHPLHLGAAERQQWSELFYDYEILQPFSQLQRPIYLLNPDELEGDTIERFNDRPFKITYQSALELGLHPISGWLVPNLQTPRPSPFGGNSPFGVQKTNKNPAGGQNTSNPPASGQNANSNSPFGGRSSPFGSRSWLNTHKLRLFHPNLQAVISYSAAQRTFAQCYFINAAESKPFGSDKRLPLSQIHPLMVSETLYTIERLLSVQTED